MVKIKPPVVELTLPVLPDMELAATKTAEVVSKHMGLNEDQAAEINMALIEACINAFEHSESDKQIEIHFKIKDDLLDLGDGKKTGKPTGQDIREKKLTLPLIHTLEKADRRTRKRLLKLLKRAPKDPKAVNEVIQAILQGPGLEYARTKMTELRNEAVEMLDVFEDTEARKALINMLDFTIERNR